MGRRRFDHLFVELSVAAGRNLPRYRLWLELHEGGWDPERLSRGAALSFCQGPLRAFLATEGIDLTPRALRRLCRTVAVFDPSLPTPCERIAAI